LHIYLLFIRIVKKIKMKKKILLAVVISSTLLWGCKDDETAPKKSGSSSSIEIKEINMGLYAKLTATWCGPCGAWGWDLNEEISESTKNNAISASIYGSASSKMSNETAIQFANDFGVKGWPSFTFNGKNRTEYSESGGIFPTTTKSNIENASSDFASSSVQMGVGGNISIEGNTLKLDWAAKAFKDQTGSFKIGAYILEDNVIEEQAGKTGNVAHHHVLRDKMTIDFYGDDFEGVLSAGTTTNLSSLTYSLDESWNKDNIEVIGIIWKMNSSGGYDFVNAARFN